MHRTFSKILLTFFLNVTLSGALVCQTYIPYQWQENRTLSIQDEKDAQKAIYFVYMGVEYQYIYDPADNQLVCYMTNHHIVRTNTSEALSQSNKVHIPIANNTELIALKARAIKTDNSYVNFNQENLKELESDQAGYKILAIEGAEAGGEIEYFYTRKINAGNFNTNKFQFDTPVKSFSYSLQCPENLEYLFKVYNWPGEVIQVDTVDQYNLYTFKTRDIPAIHNEDLSAFQNFSARLESKLGYNQNRGKGKLLTWGDAGKRIYDNIYVLNDSEKKEVGKFIKSLKLPSNPMDAFRQSESIIKGTFTYQKQSGNAGEQLDLVLVNKYANSRGFTKLFVSILDHLKIEHELVLTSNRFEKEFDPQFASWNYLEEYLIFIPKTQQFLAPASLGLRFGEIPYGYCANHGLFIRREQVQQFIYPVAYIGYIPASSYTSNFDNLTIEVKFSEGLDQNVVDVTRSFKGYGASSYKIGLLFRGTDDRKKMLDGILKYLALDADIQRLDVIKANTDYQNWMEPLVVAGQFNTKSYIESAGEIILFKAGELIGPQSEMYSKYQRILPVVNSFNRGYKRKITIDIPDGYQIQNPGDLIIKEQVLNDDNELICNFESSYSIKNNFLEIEIDEFYNEIYFPLEKFEPFRKVINAAADFNKVVLVLSK